MGIIQKAADSVFFHQCEAMCIVLGKFANTQNCNIGIAFAVIKDVWGFNVFWFRRAVLKRIDHFLHAGAKILLHHLLDTGANRCNHVPGIDVGGELNLARSVPL